MYTNYKRTKKLLKFVENEEILYNTLNKIVQG